MAIQRRFSKCLWRITFMLGTQIEANVSVGQEVTDARGGL
jgi:hypothetical protein